MAARFWTFQYTNIVRRLAALDLVNFESWLTDASRSTSLYQNRTRLSHLSEKDLQLRCSIRHTRPCTHRRQRHRHINLSVLPMSNEAIFPRRSCTNIQQLINMHSHMKIAVSATDLDPIPLESTRRTCVESFSTQWWGPGSVKKNLQSHLLDCRGHLSIVLVALIFLQGHSIQARASVKSHQCLGLKQSLRYPRRGQISGGHRFTMFDD